MNKIFRIRFKKGRMRIGVITYQMSVIIYPLYCFGVLFSLFSEQKK